MQDTTRVPQRRAASSVEYCVATTDHGGGIVLRQSAGDFGCGNILEIDRETKQIKQPDWGEGV